MGSLQATFSSCRFDDAGLFEEQGNAWNLSWSRWRFSGARHRFPSKYYFSAAVPITINIAPTNTAIATPEYNMPGINAVAIMMFFLSGNSANPYVALNYESLLCNHPHAMANTPIKETYITPLINIAVLIKFLLPGNPYSSSSSGVMS